MIKHLAIRLLFRLLKVQDHTKNLLDFQDLSKVVNDPEDYGELVKAVNNKYVYALAGASEVKYFKEWLFFQVIIKQREHVLTLDKGKKEHQRASILSFLFIISQLDSALDTKMSIQNAELKRRKKARNKKAS